MFSPKFTLVLISILFFSLGFFAQQILNFSLKDSENESLEVAAQDYIRCLEWRRDDALFKSISAELTDSLKQRYQSSLNIQQLACNHYSEKLLTIYDEIRDDAYIKTQLTTAVLESENPELVFYE